MPKYLVEASYTADGIHGLLNDGGSKRRTAVQRLDEVVGRERRGVYYAFGETDVYVIVDAPDNATAAAVSLAVSASGAVALKTTPLLTPEEIDQAAKKTVEYRAPGK